MTLDEKIAVMQAFRAGKQVQVRSVRGVGPGMEWVDTFNPNWDWVYCQYRVKPKEEKEAVVYFNVYPDGQIRGYDSERLAESCSTNAIHVAVPRKVKLPT